MYLILLLNRQPPSTQRTYVVCPYTTLFRSGRGQRRLGWQARQAEVLQARGHGGNVAFDDRVGQACLAAERAGERGHRAAGLPDDLAEGGGPVALFDEGGHRGVEEAFGAQFAALAKLHVRARPERGVRPPGRRRGWRDGLGHGGSCVCCVDRLRRVHPAPGGSGAPRSEEHTSELQSLMRISYAVFCLKKKKDNKHRYN